MKTRGYGSASVHGGAARTRACRTGAFVGAALLSSIAAAQPAEAPAGAPPVSTRPEPDAQPGASSAEAGSKAASEAPPAPPQAEAAPAAVDETEELRQRVEALEEELGYLQDDLENERQMAAERQRASIDVRAYIDTGSFYVEGNGSGVRPDIGHRFLPEYSDVSASWVFLGDPLSTAINARGEPADTGESRAVVFDSVNAADRPSFILNSIGLGLSGSPGDTVFAEALVELVPRGRNVSSTSGLFLGDFLDVKLGFARWSPHLEPFGLELYAGKMDSVLGVEYRQQDAPDRLMVTPSLICRYTCGRPIGVKARGLLPSEALVLNVAVTNGSSNVELFPFYDEVDSNVMKTFSGRLSSLLWRDGGLEVGVSGLYGAQDQQEDSDVDYWHVGADARLDWGRIVAMAEYVQGNAEGKTTPGSPDCDVAPCLEYKGAYGLLGVRATSWLTPYARVDFRDATHLNGDNFVYVSRLLRATGGGNFRFGSNVIVKAEYTVNREMDPVPQFDNNVFTSSLVLKL